MTAEQDHGGLEYVRAATYYIQDENDNKYLAPVDGQIVTQGSSYAWSVQKAAEGVSNYILDPKSKKYLYDDGQRYTLSAEQTENSEWVNFASDGPSQVQNKGTGHNLLVPYGSGVIHWLAKETL